MVNRMICIAEHSLDIRSRLGLLRPHATIYMFLLELVNECAVRLKVDDRAEAGVGVIVIGDRRVRLGHHFVVRFEERLLQKQAHRRGLWYHHLERTEHLLDDARRRARATRRH